MVGGWSRQETKLQLQQPHSRGAGETGQMRPLRSSPGRSRSATTDDRQDHHSAMGLVRIPQLHISHFKSNSLKFTMSVIILVFCFVFPPVHHSPAQRVQESSTEEKRGGTRRRGGAWGWKHSHRASCWPGELYKSSWCLLNCSVLELNVEGGESKSASHFLSKESCRNSGGWGNKRPKWSSAQHTAGRDEYFFFFHVRWESVCFLSMWIKNMIHPLSRTV